jgi:hypothetical protein
MTSLLENNDNILKKYSSLALTVKKCMTIKEETSQNTSCQGCFYADIGVKILHQKHIGITPPVKIPAVALM